MERWQRRMREIEEGAPGYRVCKAIAPFLQDWIDREKGDITYRITQMVTGYGSFKYYLYQIGKVPSPEFRYCGAEEETAEHVLGECVRWSEQREILAGRWEGDLSLAGVLRRATESEDGWRMFANFCETVMSIKERDEREWQREERARDGAGVG
ncbi:PREDICTED: uncharacterized protein LOC108781730 [Cyphomyrmex costatus]|uniref:uncharacterized protein LOC108781730 n=1 Tax=Cyphomyrmex costatus TaxID=456900 RepID=UPI00085235F1|nr:PREDICTED: uncharacterized protein LOC108781730 [Cyphomyrmex costatus]